MFRLTSRDCGPALLRGVALVAALILVAGYSGCGTAANTTGPGAVSGSVVDAEQLTTGIAGADLYIYVPEPPANTEGVAARQTDVAQAVSGADGSFLIAGVAPGCYMLRATGPAGSDYAEAQAVHIDVSLGAVTEVRVTLPAEGTLAQIESLTVSPAAPTLAPGGTQQFTATALDTDGNPVSVTPVWCADMSHVGTMGSDGLFTAGPEPGSGDVLAIVGDLVSAATVTVSAAGG